MMAEGEQPVSFDLAGRLLGGRYQVAEKVGEGGMAHVYAAHDTATNHPVAVKALLPALLDDVTAMKRLRREAGLGSRLAHPNLCHIMALHEEDGLVYVVMPFLDGEPLAIRAWRSGQLSLDETASVVRDLAAGLHCAHESGVLHRDLKPENVMIVKNPDGSERAVLLDFGLAAEQKESPGRTKLTATGMIVGTPEFMSPEQMRGRELDRRSDVYSLAFMTCELLTGELPFGGKTVRQMATARMKGEFISPRTQRPELNFPVEVDRVLGKALSVDPAERYPTALKFGAAFSRAASGRGGNWLTGWFRRG